MTTKVDLLRLAALRRADMDTAGEIRALADALDALIASVKVQERERCAKECDRLANEGMDYDGAKTCARLIRGLK